jgi:hypothetical protein
MDFSIRRGGDRRSQEFQATLIGDEPPEPADVTPLDRDELVRYSRQIGERREAWRAACDAHLADLRRVSAAVTVRKTELVATGKPRG